MKDYKDTLLMIKTDFPMRGNLGVNELPIQEKWEKLDIYHRALAKNKNKAQISLLTTDGTVVNVKFRKEYFSLFDKQISEKNPDGTKTVKEKSWFNRGNMLVINGMRSGDSFMAKKYASSPGHTLYKINEIVDGINLTLTHERYKGELEDE